MCYDRICIYNKAGLYIYNEAGLYKYTQFTNSGHPFGTNVIFYLPVVESTENSPFPKIYIVSSVVTFENSFIYLYLPPHLTIIHLINCIPGEISGSFNMLWTAISWPHECRTRKKKTVQCTIHTIKKLFPKLRSVVIKVFSKSCLLR